jgi:O-antigen/teichoic acid export membrane protein
MVDGSDERQAHLAQRVPGFINHWPSTINLSPMAWSVLGAGSVQVVQWGAGMLLARLLGREALGLLGMASAIIGGAALVVEVGLGPILVQNRSLNPRLLAAVFWIGLAVGLLSFCLLWLAASVASRALDEPGLVGVLRGGALTLLIAPLGLVQRSLLARDLRFRALAKSEMAAALVGTALALALAAAGAGVAALVSRMVVTVAVSSVLAWRTHPWRPSSILDFRFWLLDDCLIGSQSKIQNLKSKMRTVLADLRAIVPFGGSLVGAELLNQAAQNIDTLLIGRFLGAAALGDYALAYTLATVPQGRVAPALVRVMFPTLVHLQEDDLAARESYCRLVRRMAWISFPFLTGLALLGPSLLPVVYGGEWKAAATALPALCVAGAFYSMATTVGVIYRSRGRADRELWTTALRSVFLCAAVGVGLWVERSVSSVAVAIAFYAALSTLAFQPPANRLIGLRMRDYLRAWAPGVLAAGAVAAVYWLMVHR